MASIKLFLYNSRGEETPQVGYAKSFKVNYGRFKVVDKTAFRPGWKAPKKRSFLNTLLVQLETEYYFESQVQKQEKIEYEKSLTAYELYSKRPKLALIKKEKVARSQIIIENFTDREGVVHDREVMIEHVKTASPLYTKQYIHKIVSSGAFDNNFLDLIRMNFTLKKPIEMTVYNHLEMMQLMYFYFYPHLSDFYRRSKRTEKWFIFRIKYTQVYQKSQKRKVTVYEKGKKKRKEIATALLRSGVGYSRFKPVDLKSFMDYIQETYVAMMIDPGETGSLLGYLQRKFTKSFFITGFSIEVVKKVIEFGV